MPEVATPHQAEREFETRTDESFKNANATGGAAHNENQRVTYANIKRTYDVYQDLDIQAATAALTLPFHNGRTEGASTRTKMIKRQMYGRAGFALLRHRILLV